MGKVKDLTGQKFNKLTVIKRVENDKRGEATWLCKCECGNSVKVLGSSLRKGVTKSCGCYKREKFNNYRHGLCHTRLYNIYKKIIQRVENPNCKEYKWYGGRGISICDEWKNDFMTFYNWAMQNGYADTLSIDRIDNDRGYCPENCRWVSSKEQQRNKRNNHRVTYNGETKCVSEWEEFFGLKQGTIEAKLCVNSKKGDLKESEESLLHKIVTSTKHDGGSKHKSHNKHKSYNKHKSRYITYKGETRSVSDWERTLNFPKNLIHRRLHYGWSEERALSTPPGIPRRERKSK